MKLFALQLLSVCLLTLAKDYDPGKCETMCFDLQKQSALDRYGSMNMFCKMPTTTTKEFQSTTEDLTVSTANSDDHTSTSEKTTKAEDTTTSDWALTNLTTMTTGTPDLTTSVITSIRASTAKTESTLKPSTLVTTAPEPTTVAIATSTPETTTTTETVSTTEPSYVSTETTKPHRTTDRFTMETIPEATVGKETATIAQTTTSSHLIPTKQKKEDDATTKMESLKMETSSATSVHVKRTPKDWTISPVTKALLARTHKPTNFFTTHTKQAQTTITVETVTQRKIFSIKPTEVPTKSFEKSTIANEIVSSTKTSQNTILTTELLEMTTNAEAEYTSAFTDTTTTVERSFAISTTSSETPSKTSATIAETSTSQITISTKNSLPISTVTTDKPISTIESIINKITQEATTETRETTTNGELWTTSTQKIEWSTPEASTTPNKETSAGFQASTTTGKLTKQSNGMFTESTKEVNLATTTSELTETTTEVIQPITSPTKDIVITTTSDYTSSIKWIAKATKTNEKETTTTKTGANKASTTLEQIIMPQTTTVIRTTTLPQTETTLGDGVQSSTVLTVTPTTELETTPDMETSTNLETTSLPVWCNHPCPIEYVEGENACYRMIPLEYRKSFMSSLMWCRQEDRRDLVDKADIATSNGIELLKYMFRIYGITSDIMYLNGHADYLMRQKKRAGLIHLNEISIWDNSPFNYTGLSKAMENVTGICRMPKFCEKPVCDLSQIYKALPDQVEEVSNKTLPQGSSIKLKCLEPSRDVLVVRCVAPGELTPHPDYLKCTIPADVKYEAPEKEVPGNMKIRDSCEECYRDGTDTCTAEGNGFKCTCKHGWNKFTCYKPVDLCPPNFCTVNGKCVTELDEFFCQCNKGFTGERCEINIQKITWAGNRTIRIISSNTFASGMFAASNGMHISLKILSKVITDKNPHDPQETYQDFRSTVLTVGGLAIAVIQHPDLLFHEPISCRWFFILVQICFSLGFVFMVNEAVNVVTTIHGRHINNWLYDNNMEKVWWLGIPARVMVPFVLVFALLWFVCSHGWSVIPSTWTCFGVFTREASNSWYPLVIFNFACMVMCLALADSAQRTLSHRRQFWTASMHLVEVSCPYNREQIEKVRRNVPFCLLIPPFAFLNWIFICLAADKQTETLKNLSLLFSGIYTVTNLMQTLVTSTGIYEYVVYYGHLYLPNFIASRLLEDLTPIKWMNKSEIVASKKKTIFNGLEASSHRLTHLSTPEEATLSVYFNELQMENIYLRNAPVPELHQELIVNTWIEEVRRIDRMKIPPKEPKQRETWRTRLRKNAKPPPKENTNLRRIRFLRNRLDYHLKTINTIVEYQIIGPMQRTDFLTFSPASSCVLRSQLEDLRRSWFPTMERYIERDWELREMYKTYLESIGVDTSKEKNECKKNDIVEDYYLDELRPGFIGPRSFPLFYLPALEPYLELDYYQRFRELEFARMAKHSEYLEACYDFAR